MRFTVNRVALWSLAALSLVAAPCRACMQPYEDSVKQAPAVYVEGATVIVSGRATSIRSEGNDAVIARLEIDRVFKGEAPRVLVVRANRVRDLCGQVRPPESEPFFAFLSFQDGNIQAPNRIGFVRQSAMPPGFAQRLGRARPPGDFSPRLSRLAPRGIAEPVNRVPGEVSEESWVVNFDLNTTYPDDKARFYLRYPNGVFLMDSEYVLEKIATWAHSKLLEQVRASLPLTESTDLYKYVLTSEQSYNLNELMDRLAVDAVIERRAKIFVPFGCCLRTVRVTRTSIGVQTVSTYPDIELLRTTWVPD